MVAAVAAASVAVAGAAVMFGADAANAAPSHADATTPSATPVTFSYQGAQVQTYSVPDGIGWVQLQVIGGGGGPNNNTLSASDGAQVTGTVKVSTGDKLLISAAGSGNNNFSGGGPGGWGGLGANGGDGNSASDDLRNGGAGGGASTVQIQGSDAPQTLIIAGGGGGMGGASGDPSHAGSGGTGGANGRWTGSNGGNGTEGPLGGKGGKAAGQSGPAGARGEGGSGLGGNGGAGGGGANGGSAGSGAKGASAAGGGGAGSSWAAPAVTGAAVKQSGVHWYNPLYPSPVNAPNGSIVVTPIAKVAPGMQLTVQNTQITQGATTGPITAVIPTTDGYTPTGAVDFADVTNAAQPVDLGSAPIVNGTSSSVATIPQATPALQTVGTHEIQASWAGDTNYAAATSNTITVTVTATTARHLLGNSDTRGLGRYPGAMPQARSLDVDAAADTSSGAPGITTAICVLAALVLVGAGTVLVRRRRHGHRPAGTADPS